MENQIRLNQVLLQKQNKSFEEMEECKNRNSSCQAVSYTACFTGGQLGSIGSGEHTAPAMKCILCHQDGICRKKLVKSRLGWY
ncbi:MAG: hypothetical protein IPK91_06250 [Saprospiraceae bacterium]|nr:hypothetical protein [Saprospiraceae bacterium]